jgi:hypothetical protein
MTIVELCAHLGRGIRGWRTNLRGGGADLRGRSELQRGHFGKLFRIVQAEMASQAKVWSQYGCRQSTRRSATGS